MRENMPRYLGLELACPFLEDDACSIYAERPSACREYLVSSPKELCARPLTEPVQAVPIRFCPWRARRWMRRRGTERPPTTDGAADARVGVRGTASRGTGAPVSLRPVAGRIAGARVLSGLSAGKHDRGIILMLVARFGLILTERAPGLRQGLSVRGFRNLRTGNEIAALTGWVITPGVSLGTLWSRRASQEFTKRTQRLRLSREITKRTQVLRNSRLLQQ